MLSNRIRIRIESVIQNYISWSGSGSRRPISYGSTCGSGSTNLVYSHSISINDDLKNLVLVPSLFTVVTERPMTSLLATLAIYLFDVSFHQKRTSFPWTFFNKLYSLTILIWYPPGLFMRGKKEEKIVFLFFLKIVLYIFSNSHQSGEVHNKMKFLAFSQRYSSVLWL